MSYLKKINTFWFILVVLFILPSLYGVWYPGFFVSDDGNWMVIRFSAFYQAFAEGQFPVRFLDRLNYSYGYPVANFLYPGFMYLGTPLKVIGFDSLQVIKILLSVFMVLGGVFVFFWLNSFFSQFSAFVGAVIYTYSPYHLYNLYKRGSVGELMSLSIVPFVLWMIERKSFFFTSLGIFLLLISHNTLALLFILFIFGYSMVRKRFVWAIWPIVVGGLLSSFFTIPALLDLRYTQFASIKISDPLDHFADFRLIGVGSIAILLVTTITLILVYVKRRVSEKKYLAVFSVVLSLMLTFFTVAMSDFIWQVVPSSWIQFPFRLLSVTLIAVSFLGAYVVYNFMPKFRIIVGGILILIVIVFSDQYLVPKEYSNYEIGFYDTNESLTTTHAEYMPIGVKVLPYSRPDNLVEPFKGEMFITNVTEKSNNITFDVSASSSGSVKINRVYFPGWNYQINNDRKKIPFVEDDGLMYVPIMSGSHIIQVSFEETPIRSLANFLTIIGGLILLIVPSRRIINKVFK